MKTSMWKRLLALLLVAVMLVVVSPLANAANYFEEVFEVSKDDVPVRTEPTNAGTVVQRADAGQYVTGKLIRNTKNSLWIQFKDVSGNTRYIYTGNTKAHTHNWIEISRLPIGVTSLCLCGTMQVQTPYASVKTVNGLDTLRQVVYGNYSKDQSIDAILISMALGEFRYVNEAMGIRDLTADFYWCTIGDTEECSPVNLLMDVASVAYGQEYLRFFRHADKLQLAGQKLAILDRIKTVFHADDLIKYRDDFDKLKKITLSSKNVIVDTYHNLRKVYKDISEDMDIECHHLIEKRLKELFSNSNTDDWISVPLDSDIHGRYTKAWNKEIRRLGEGKYKGNVQWEDIEKAIRNVYKDAPILLETALEWAMEHWIG